MEECRYFLKEEEKEADERQAEMWKVIVETTMND